MNTAPFQRQTDKVVFTIGVIIIMTFCYTVGKYPHGLFYDYMTALTVSLLFLRVFQYTSMGYHWYIIDFCYYANVLVLYMVNYAPKDDQLFKICFLFSNGTLGLSVWMFRNSLVFHKLDILTSLAIHVVPLLTMYHARWFTIEEQRYLMDDKKFVDPLKEESWLEYLYSMLVLPTLFYLCWVVVYSMLNFYIKKKFGS